MKKYRVDCFGYDDNTGKVSDHTIDLFDDIQDAVIFASDRRKKGYVTWLLTHVFDGKYQPFVKLL